MKRVITAPPQTADQKLEPVSAFQWSSKTLFLKALDDEIEALNVRIFRTSDPATGEPRAPYDGPRQTLGGGLW